MIESISQLRDYINKVPDDIDRTLVNEQNVDLAENSQQVDILTSSWNSEIIYSKLKDNSNRFIATIFFKYATTKCPKWPGGFGPLVYIASYEKIQRIINSGSAGTTYLEEWSEGKETAFGFEHSGSETEYQKFKAELQGELEEISTQLDGGISFENNAEYERKLNEKARYEELIKWFETSSLLDEEIKMKGKYALIENLSEWNATFRSYTGINIPARTIYGAFKSLDIPFTPDNWNRIKFIYKNAIDLIGTSTSTSDIKFAARLKLVGQRIIKAYNPIFQSKQLFNRLYPIVRKFGTDLKHYPKNVYNSVLLSFAVMKKQLFGGVSFGFKIGSVIGFGIPFLSTILGIIGGVVGGLIGAIKGIATIGGKTLISITKTLWSVLPFGVRKGTAVSRAKQQRKSLEEKKEQYGSYEYQARLKAANEKISRAKVRRRKKISRNVIRQVRKL